MTATFLQQVERAYFVRKSGGATRIEPLNNIKRRYMSGVIGAGVNSRTPLKQLEKLWLLSVLGAAAINFNSIEELWRQAVLSISKIPSKFLNDNKITFYINAP